MSRHTVVATCRQNAQFAFLISSIVCIYSKYSYLPLTSFQFSLLIPLPSVTENANEVTLINGRIDKIYECCVTHVCMVVAAVR